jgi:hypothetical protein
MTRLIPEQNKALRARFPYKGGETMKVTQVFHIAELWKGKFTKAIQEKKSVLY